MPVTVDHQPLQTETLGLKTIGQVLAHLQQQDRLVVNVLIDGSEPDLSDMGSIKQSTIYGHTLFIEPLVMVETKRDLGEMKLPFQA